MPENAVAGRDVAEIALVVAQRTVAAHVEHVLGTLMTPTRTLAEVRPERAGRSAPWAQELSRGGSR